MSSYKKLKAQCLELLREKAELLRRMELLCREEDKLSEEERLEIFHIKTDVQFTKRGIELAERAYWFGNGSQISFKGTNGLVKGVQKIPKSMLDEL